MAEAGDSCMTACGAWKNTAVVFFFSSPQMLRLLLVRPGCFFTGFQETFGHDDLKTALVMWLNE